MYLERVTLTNVQCFGPGIFGATRIPEPFRVSDDQSIRSLAWSEVADMIPIGSSVYGVGDLIVARERVRDNPLEPDPAAHAL